MIAATAVANALPVYTANPDDFISIEGLEIVAVEPSSISADPPSP